MLAIIAWLGDLYFCLATLAPTSHIFAILGSQALLQCYSQLLSALALALTIYIILINIYSLMFYIVPLWLFSLLIKRISTFLFCGKLYYFLLWLFFNTYLYSRLGFSQPSPIHFFYVVNICVTTNMVLFPSCITLTYYRHLCSRVKIL